MGWKKILVLTFKPAVQSEWRKDLQGHIDFEGWQFVSKDTELQFADRDPDRPCVWFASFQDMLGRTDIGGIKPRNEEAHATQWDCIILDEYHFGAWNESSKELYDAEDTRTEAETDSQGDQVGIRSECPNDQVAVTTFGSGIGTFASMEAQGEKTSNSAEENECAVA